MFLFVQTCFFSSGEYEPVSFELDFVLGSILLDGICFGADVQIRSLNWKRHFSCGEHDSIFSDGPSTSLELHQIQLLFAAAEFSRYLIFRIC